MAHKESSLELSLDQLRRARLAGSGLIEPFASPEEAAIRLIGIQAQIEPAAGLALWNRTRGLAHDDFQARIYVSRTLVKLWGQRHTLHAYTATDWPLLYAAHAAFKTWWQRRADMPQSSITAYSHHLEQIAEVLRSRESMGRNDLRALNLDLHEDLYSGWGGIFADLVRQGVACHAGREGSEGRFAHRERWLPGLEWKPPDAESANVELARRYFAAYGPATPEDFAHWRGYGLGAARQWTAALGPELAQVRVEGKPMLVAAGKLEALAALPAGKAAAEGLPVKMLFRFDPMMLGHLAKEWVVAAGEYPRVWRPAGHIEGVVLFRGRAVAVWRYERKPGGLVVAVAPFRRLPAAVSARLPKVAAGVATFFGLPLADLRTVEELPSASAATRARQAPAEGQR